MAYSISITERTILSLVRLWLLGILEGPPTVVQGLDNRVPVPKGPFICLTTVGKTRLATNERVYHRYQVETDTDQLNTLMRTEQEIQVDIYGTDSADRAEIIAILWRDFQACEFFPALNAEVQALYCSEPQLMPITNSEAQWESRWMITLHLQYNPTVSVPQEYADAANVTLVNVEATFPT